MLSVEGIDVFYEDLQALWSVSLEVGEGELVALVGPNGAGKTTVLRAISGLLRPASGRIRFRGRTLGEVSAHDVVGLGISQVPESGRIFGGMSVLENLELGAFLRQARREKDRSLKWVFEIFPRLEERKAQLAGTLSGGERQMLAIGRAMMAKPKLLMLDEPSFGLAPILVAQTFDMVAKINAEGVAVLLVEQNVRAALGLAGRAYLLENGRIVGQGAEKDLLTFESVRSAYLA